MATYTNDRRQYQTVTTDNYSPLHQYAIWVSESWRKVSRPTLLCQSRIEGRSGQPVGVLVSTLVQCIGVLHGSHLQVTVDEWQGDRYSRRGFKGQTFGHAVTTGSKFWRTACPLE
ncbi:MAG: hypothetical protein AAFS00_20345, partial [Bacteroidota bacterium]